MVELSVPASIQSGDRWELIESDTQRLADTPLVTVTATRALYGDRRLRERVRTATGIDRLWRSFFASRLATKPPLSPRIADLVVRTIARPQAAKRFASDLSERGFEGVEKRDDREIAVGERKRARATRFTATVPVEGASCVDVDAWLAVWDCDDEMVATGGTYPVGSLGVEGADDVFDPPGEYRRELFDLIREVA